MKLLMENWRKYLAEDAARRRALAQDISDLENKGQWDTEAANVKYRMKPSPKAYKEMMTKGRAIKKLFAKHADRSFLESVVTIHWSYRARILELLKSGSSKDELSAEASLPGQFRGGALGDVGLIVKGHITLLANDMDELMTGAGRDYRTADPERTKMSGANKGVRQNFPPEMYEEGRPLLVLDKEDWDPRSESLGNEALVDNWKLIGIIASDAPDMAFFKNVVDTLGLDIPVMMREEAEKKL